MPPEICGGTRSSATRLATHRDVARIAAEWLLDQFRIEPYFARKHEHDVLIRTSNCGRLDKFISKAVAPTRLPGNARRFNSTVRRCFQLCVGTPPLECRKA